MEQYNFSWLENNIIKTLVNSLSYSNHKFKFVGGCVRDSLIFSDITKDFNNIDFDIASNFTPEENLYYLQKNNIKTIPSGIKYGTITAIINHIPFQITSLRKDISTNGRHPKVSFSKNFFEDALRRDFTFNALYLDPIDGKLTDYFNGQEDLYAKRVNFIGDTKARIKEDYLRILRFFRFYSLYGAEYPSEETLNIIRNESYNLNKLSIERINGEFYKLLKASNPTMSLKLMLKTNVLTQIMSLSYDGINCFNNLIEIENITNIKSVNIRQALLNENLENNKIIIKKSDIKEVSNIILLKNFIMKHGILEASEIYELLCHYSYQDVIAALMVNASLNANVKYHYLAVINKIITKAKKNFPINGNDLIKIGIQGIDIKHTLDKLKKLYWQSPINSENIENKNYYLKHVNPKHINNSSEQ